MTTKDVITFVTAQRRPEPGAENVVRIADGLSGLSAATIKRRLAAVSSLYGYLITRDDIDHECQPGAPRHRHAPESSDAGRGLPLVRGVRRLPRILDPDDIEVLFGSAAHRARPGHGPSHALGRPPALRGPRAQTRGPAAR